MDDFPKGNNSLNMKNNNKNNLNQITQSHMVNIDNNISYINKNEIN